MPFTISHAAAVLPLHKWTKAKLPLAALMIGSMSPDFAYFLPGDPGRMATHSIAGVLSFCWPVSLVIWVLFVRVLERPTLALMPETWAARIHPPTRHWTLATLAVASAAIILGALTHLIWDSFTHTNTVVTDALPGLHAVAFRIGGARIRWYGVLQHSSTVIGMVVLTIWAIRRLRSPPAADLPGHSLPSISNTVRAVAAVVLIAVSFAYAIVSYALHPYIAFEHRLFHFAIGGMTGFALAWLAIAVWIGARWRATRR